MKKVHTSEEREINRRQKRFVAEYVIDLNGTQAAIRSGYSKKTANEQAAQLLAKLSIQAAVSELLIDRELRTQITADNVLTGLYKTASCDVAEAYNPDGTFKNIHDIPKEVRQAITGIESLEVFTGSGEDRVKIGEIKKVKFGDKTRPHELLGKHLRILTDRVEVVNLSEQWERSTDEEKWALINKIKGTLPKQIEG